jgi:hypothetical protein
MANMTKIIDCHAADIHLDLTGLNGLKNLLRTGKGVIDLQHRAIKRGQGGTNLLD